MKSKKKTSLSTREAALIAILGFILLGFLYYQFYYTPNKTNVSTLNSQTETYRSQTAALSARVEQVRAMQSAVADAQENALDISIPDYDNSKAMIAELNGILSATEEFSIKFGAVSRNDYIYERPVQIGFKCGSYLAARQIISRLNDSEFFNQISDVTITQSNGSYDDNGNYQAPCSVSLNITYFEVDG